MPKINILANGGSPLQWTENYALKGDNGKYKFLNEITSYKYYV
jgi:hypothetical protein